VHKIAAAIAAVFHFYLTGLLLWSSRCLAPKHINVNIIITG